MKTYSRKLKAAATGAFLFSAIFSLQWVILGVRPNPFSYILPILVGTASGLAIHYFKSKWEKQAVAVQREKLKSVREIAGAVCHEMNQPLQTVMGTVDIILMDMPLDDPNRPHLESILTQTRKMGGITNKLMHLRSYATKPYLSGEILDIERSTKL